MGTAAIFWDFAARPPFLHNYQGTKTPGTTPIDHLIACHNYLANAAQPAAHRKPSGTTGGFGIGGCFAPTLLFIYYI